MTERTPLDLVRDLVEGRLAPADAESARAAIDADPALRAAFEEFRVVHALTAPASSVPPCGVSFESLDAGAPATPSAVTEPAVRPAHRWLAVAAAAALAAVAIGAGASFLRPPEPREVALAVLASQDTGEDSGASADAAAVPASLADLRAASGGHMRWIADYDEGLALAKASGLPMLVYVHFPGCPACAMLDGETFGDGAVQERADPFVPLRIDVRDAPEDLKERASRGWPYMAVIDADGQVLEEFPGMLCPEEMTAKLAEAARAATKRRTRPTPADVREATAALRRADQAREEGRRGAAFRDYGDAASRGAGLVSEVAGRAARSLRREAAAELTKARSTAAGDTEAALRDLDAAARIYEGSPPGDDLAAVAAALRDTGVFPLLKERKP